MEDLIAVLALGSIALFVIGLKRLSRVRTARSGNLLLAAGMLLAVVLTLVEEGDLDARWIAAGLAAGALLGAGMVQRTRAEGLPGLVARLNGFGGAASALVAVSLFWLAVVDSPGTAAEGLGAASASTLVLSVLVGAATFSGSVLAELKLGGTRVPERLPARAVLMVVLVAAGLAAGVAATFALGDPGPAAAAVVVALTASLLVGVVLVVPIGGADMPVVISLLNSLSGLAAALTGFALGHTLLIIAGTIVGAAGLILTQIMCAAMNRSLLNVLIGGFTAAGDDEGYEHVVSADAESAAMVLEAARSVIIVPGYGLAAAHAQTAVADLTAALQAQGADVRFAIHPVAGRMPGHMNVVLAEADIPYELLFEMDEINHDLPDTDVVIVIGANDVVNPAARDDPDSPLAGMPILDVDQAQRVFVIKRSLSPGYAGIKNELFERDNTVMLFGDAKSVLVDLVKELGVLAR